MNVFEKYAAKKRLIDGLIEKLAQSYQETKAKASLPSRTGRTETSVVPREGGDPYHPLLLHATPRGADEPTSTEYAAKQSLPGTARATSLEQSGGSGGGGMTFDYKQTRPAQTPADLPARLVTSDGTRIRSPSVPTRSRPTSTRSTRKPPWAE